MTSHGRRLASVVLLFAWGVHAQTAELASDWSTLQKLLGGIQGTITTPPAGIVTEKYTTGMLMGNGDIGVVAGDTASRQKFYFGKSDFWGGEWHPVRKRLENSILPLGGLTVSCATPGAEPAAVYRMVQDILRAEVRTTMQLGPADVHMRSWTADDGNFFVTELATDPGSPPVTLDISLWMPPDNPNIGTKYPFATGASDGVLWATRRNNLDGPDDYQARAAVAAAVVGGKFDGTRGGGAEITGSLTLKPGAPVHVVAAFASAAGIGPGGTPLDTLRTQALHAAAAVTAKDVARLQAAHLAWWKNYWLKSYVRVGDPVLEAFYYGSLYVLGSAVRPGHPAPSLWANWVTTDQPAWGGRFFINYNAEAPYYGIYSANRPELALPYIDVILAERPYQENRTAAAGYKGICYQRSYTPFSLFRPAPARTPVAAVKDYKRLPTDQKSNATFAAFPILWYWEYTRDPDFLKNKLYPHLKALDAFWRDYMTWDESGKRWVIENTSAHEASSAATAGDLNPNLDVGFMRTVLRKLLETSELLGADADLRPTWRDVLAHLSRYPTGMVNGKEVYYEAERMVRGNLFHFSDQPINMEGTVFPGENLAIGGDPKQLQIALNSLEELNSWGVTRGGNSNNGFCKEFPIAARVGWPAEDLIAKFKAAILHQWRPSNLTVFQGGGGIETVGSMEALNSMLLQSEGGVLRLFPVWPTARDASFKRLRAKGAFVVSSELVAGRVAYVEIASEKGLPVTLLNPWKPGARVSVRQLGGGTVATTVQGDNILFPTKPGGRYRVTGAAQ